MWWRQQRRPKEPWYAWSNCLVFFYFLRIVFLPISNLYNLAGTVYSSLCYRGTTKVFIGNDWFPATTKLFLDGKRLTFVFNPNPACKIKRLSNKEKLIRDCSLLLIGLSRRWKIDQKSSCKERFSFKVVDITTEANSWANNFTNILPMGLNNWQNGDTLMMWYKSGGVDNHILFALFGIQKYSRTG